MKTESLEQRLREYAKSYSDKHHSEWPTVRQLAKRYGCTQQEVLDAAEQDGMDVIVGVQVSGVGYAAEERIGDYKIEWYEDRP
jgi:orotate phosphoribosyltransferase-like protein